MSRKYGISEPSTEMTTIYYNAVFPGFFAMFVTNRHIT